MRNKNRDVLLSVIVLCIAVVAAMAALRAQTQSESSSTIRDYADYDQIPVADKTAPEPADPQKRAVRKARGKKFNSRLDNPKDIQNFRITENSESGYGGFPSHAPAEPALPVSQSDVVIIGEVTNAQAYLSDDETDVYSEFDVRIDEVLKHNAVVPVNIGDQIAATRGGGAVRFSSGKIYRTAFRGKHYPRKGKRYLLFLNSDAETQSFSIITGYELRGGRVYPLDGFDKILGVIPQLASHQKYKGVDEAAFLNEVREAISRISVNAPESGR